MNQFYDKIQTSIQSSNEEKYANYICQRKAPLKHFNQKLTVITVNSFSQKINSKVDLNLRKR
jgi:hypothetical protein